VSAAAEELRHKFVIEYEALDESIRMAFDDARFAFLEAVGACVDTRFLSSAVMSRTALEAALFLARISEKTSAGTPVIQGSVMRILPDAQLPYWALEKWARKHHLLGKKLAIHCEKVRRIGNFAAHYAEQLARNRANFIARARQNVTPEGAKSHVEVGAYSMWVTAEDAYWSLNITRHAILSIARAWTRIED